MTVLPAGEYAMPVAESERQCDECQMGWHSSCGLRDCRCMCIFRNLKVSYTYVTTPTGHRVHLADGANVTICGTPTFDPWPTNSRVIEEAVCGTCLKRAKHMAGIYHRDDDEA